MAYLLLNICRTKYLTDYSLLVVEGSLFTVDLLDVVDSFILNDNL